MIGEKHELRDSMSLEEATVSNMWQMAAVVDVLERKGLCTKQDLYDIITEFRRKNPHASIPETASLERYLFNETENKIIDDLLELLKKPGLTSHQSVNLLEQLGRICLSQPTRVFPQPAWLIGSFVVEPNLPVCQNFPTQCLSGQDQPGRLDRAPVTIHHLHPRI
jgi:hypothetical protein